MNLISQILLLKRIRAYKGTFIAGKDVTSMKRCARKFLQDQAARRIVGNEDRSE
jgi:hypothetical protein